MLDNVKIQEEIAITSDKLDRRKKYTRMVLKDSMMTLLKEKTITSITVKELCELADINRSTFYAHYADQYDLLTQIEDELIEDMNMYLSGFNVEKEEDNIRMTEKLLEYFGSKQDECKTLLNEHGDSSFQNKATVVAQHFIMKSWMEMEYIDTKLSEYLSSFIISGCMQMIKKWLFNGMDRTPREMAELINNVVNKGIRGLN